MRGITRTIQDEIDNLKESIINYENIKITGDMKELRRWYTMIGKKDHMNLVGCDKDKCGNNFNGNCCAGENNFIYKDGKLECAEMCKKGLGYLDKMIKEFKKELKMHEESLHNRTI